MRRSNGLHLPQETVCCLSLDSCWKHSLPGRFECPLVWNRMRGEPTPGSVIEFSTTVSDTGTAQTEGKTSELAVQGTKVNSLSHFIHWIPCRAIKPSLPVSYACVCTHTSCLRSPRRTARYQQGMTEAVSPNSVSKVGAGCKVSTEGSNVQWRGRQSQRSPGKTRNHPISRSSSLRIWVTFLTCVFKT